MRVVARGSEKGKIDGGIANGARTSMRQVRRDNVRPVNLKRCTSLNRTSW